MVYLIPKEQVKQRFASSADTYDDFATVQRQLGYKLLEIIKSTGKDYTNILEIGCGTGFFTQLLHESYPNANILALDIAPSMVDKARERLGENDKVSFLVADGEDLSLGYEEPFDLVVSNVVFQWFSQYDKAFTNYFNLLKEEGALIFNTLGYGTFRELYQLQGKDNPFKTKGEILEFLQMAGFDTVSCTEEEIVQYFSTCREFLRGIKKIGADTSMLPETGEAQNRQGVFGLVKQYNLEFSTPKGIQATYVPMFFSAYK